MSPIPGLSRGSFVQHRLLLHREPACGPNSRVVPWPPSGYPTRHVRPVVPVVLPEPALEARLFEPWRSTAVFRRKKTTTQTNRGHEPKNSDSAVSIRRTPVIIGFRTWRYGPTTTSFVGGSHGAGVPSPLSTNSLVVQPARRMPGAANRMANQNQGCLRFCKRPGRWPPGRNPEYGARNEEEARPWKNDDSFRESHVNSCWRLAVDTPMLPFVGQVCLVGHPARRTQATASRRPGKVDFLL